MDLKLIYSKIYYKETTQKRCSRLCWYLNLVCCSRINFVTWLAIYSVQGCGMEHVHLHEYPWQNIFKHFIGPATKCSSVYSDYIWGDAVMTYVFISKWTSYFGPQVHPKGSLVFTLVCVSVRPSVFRYLRDCWLVILEFYMKLRINKVEKVIRLEFWKNLNPRLKRD